MSRLENAEVRQSSAGTLVGHASVVWHDSEVVHAGRDHAWLHNESIDEALGASRAFKLPPEHSCKDLVKYLRSTVGRILRDNDVSETR